MLCGQAAFDSTRANLLARPWAVDDLDTILDVYKQKHYSKALLFVDNAGSDVILGAGAFYKDLTIIHILPINGSIKR